MILTALALQHFRSYDQATFTFSPQTTVIIGPNTAGKSNLLEGIFLLSTGKSFKAEKDTQMIEFGQSLARVKCVLTDNGEKDQLEVTIQEATASMTTRSYSKRFMLNGIAKRRVDFAGRLPALLFVPSDLDIIISSPSQRREFLNTVLEMVDRQYRLSLTAYEKAVRQRNALLDVAKETGIRNEEQFSYWDHLLIEHGSYITQKREEIISYFNTQPQALQAIKVQYDKSEISEERLEQYRGPELGAGVTLVGPHRDDFYVEITDKQGQSNNAKHYGSRGQQRLVVLQLKLLQLTYIESILGQRPLLLLDDIFSELDEEHIDDVLKIVDKQQTIITTTHREFVRSGLEKTAQIIELKKE